MQLRLKLLIKFHIHYLDLKIHLAPESFSIS